MFADVTATPDPKIFWELVLSIGLVASIVANFATVISVRRTQKREINFGFVPASNDDFEKHLAANQKEHENLFSKLGGVERGARERLDMVTSKWQDRIDEKFSTMQAADQAGRKEIHQRIDQVLVAVSKMEGRVMRHS